MLFFPYNHQEWAEPIKRDIEEMKKPQVQPPLSSAYLEAGPTKKRKVSGVVMHLVDMITYDYY